MPAGSYQYSDRLLCSNNPEFNSHFINNRVTNSKYTVLTFVPLLLWAHLRRFMNLYFIIIGVLQMWDAVTPVNPMTTWLPIFMIFTIAFIREGIDDYHQHETDKIINTRKFDIIHDKKRVLRESQTIMPGDVVVLKKNQECPCDLCLIHSSNENGHCCIETANLDGETRLKERVANKQTQALGVYGITNRKIYIRCDLPCKDIYEFSGTLSIDAPDVDPIRINEQQLIQQGVFLRSTEYILGIACYTGKETKLGQNTIKPPIKWTSLEKFVNKASIFIFIVQIVLAIIAGSVGNWKKNQLKKTEHYLRLEEDKPVAENMMFLIMYVRCYLLTSIMIPISLKVTLDVCKYIYAVWIMNDRKMYNVETGQKAIVNNTSVIEDLGAIEYLFTDKTGTLTENKMTLKKIAFEGVYFGHSETADDLLKDETFANAIKDPSDKFHAKVVNAISCLAVCHTLNIREEKDGKVLFEGVSPEEVAFVSTLEELGVKIREDNDVITIKGPKYDLDMTFEVIDILKFTFERRMMSVIVKNVNTGSFLLFSKGAHEKMFEKCQSIYQKCEEQTNIFSSLGLRVMAIGFKKLSDTVIRDFIKKSSEMDNQTELYNSLESGQILIGITGIEDKLQEDVPQSIQLLRDGGIKVWMVTGDLLNTAINIARSTRLISNEGELIHLSVEKAGCSAKELLENVKEYMLSNTHTEFYLAIEGNSSGINDFLGDYRKEFAEVASLAKSVICARTMPQQKALFVKAIKELGHMTLAIGDGGNDVTMLREAHIGVGIIGKEGRQAANTADFAISNFSSIQRLLLIHGRYSAYRTSWLVQFCFYKSFLLALIQLSYSFYNGFSGISFVNDFNLMCYNAIFTLLPVIFFLLDKDVDEVTLFLHPYLYTDTRKRTFLNKRTLFWWFIRAIYQAIIISLLTFNTFTVNNFDPIDGTPSNLGETQQVVYSVLILVVIITTTIDTQNFTALNFMFIWGNWILYLFLASMANLVFNLSITRDMFLVMWRVMSSPVDWIASVVITGVATIPVIFIQALFSTYLPTRAQSLKFYEVERGCKFEPAYYFNMDDKNNKDIDFDRSYDPSPETVWDRTHSIIEPLLVLLHIL